MDAGVRSISTPIVYCRTLGIRAVLEMNDRFENGVYESVNGLIAEFILKVTKYSPGTAEAEVFNDWTSTGCVPKGVDAPLGIWTYHVLSGCWTTSYEPLYWCAIPRQDVEGVFAETLSRP